MSGFEPGEGWREVASLGHDLADVDSDGIHYRLDGVDRYWVRVAEPVPPLPTEPWSVIRAQGDGFEAEFIRLPNGSWRTFAGTRIEFLPELAAECFTGFEVLAEPRRTETISDVHADRDRVRRETAKAVADWFAKNVPLTAEIYGGALRAFGVEL